MGSIGMPELLIILVILLLLFGASKLPRLARSIGEAKKEFDEAVAEGKRKSDQKPTQEAASAEPASSESSPKE
jgi:sec-independent protein translocase protein TatA